MISLRQWATRKLQRGDLAALLKVSRNLSTRMEVDQLMRLSRRGFIRKRADNNLQVTLKGRAALRIRQSIASLPM